METLANVDVNEYDVLHVNLCAATTGYVGELKRRLGANSSTIIVANMDYSPRHIGAYWRGNEWLRDLEMADRIFAVTHSQIRCFGHALRPKTIHLCPHPTDIEGLRSIRMPSDKRDGLAVVWHGYNQDNSLPIMAAAEHPIIPWLIGSPDQPPNALYGRSVSSSPPPVFVRWLSSAKIVYDTHQAESYGRIPIEVAALGIPCVGSSMSESMLRLWPKTCADAWWDMMSIREHIKRLVEDGEWEEQTTKLAEESVAYYDDPHSRSRWSLMLEESP